MKSGLAHSSFVTGGVYALNKGKFSEIFTQLAVLINSMGYECIGSEFINSDGIKILRVYLDVQGGVDVSDCEKVSRGIAEYLDSVDSLLPEKYYLEVSSPGLERPLFTPEDYQKFVGREIEITLKGNKTIIGVISSITTAVSVTLSCKKETREIMFTDIVKGKLLYQNEYGEKKTFKKISPKKKKK